MMSKKVARNKVRTRGAVMVELAICLPVILIMLAGMANLGSILWQIQQMSDAARHGSRLAAAKSNDGTCTVDGFAQTVSNNYVSASNADPMNWWGDAQPSIFNMTWPATPNNPTGFYQSAVKIEFTTGSASQGKNCMVCFGNILRKLNVRVQAVFALEGCP